MVIGWPCVCSGMPNLRLVVACGRGPLSVVVQVGVLVPGLLLVEFSRARGHVVDFLQFFSSMLPLVPPPLPPPVPTCWRVITRSLV